MIAVLKNNLRRLIAQKQLIILLVIFTIAASVAAILISTKWTQSWDIAVQSGHEIVSKSDNINLIELEQQPNRSDMVSGQYDAILSIAPDGNYTIDTIQSEKEAAKMLAVLNGQESADTSFNHRGAGTNILGFLTTFILLTGSIAMSMFADDKEFGQINRVAASPLKMNTYLFSNCLFNFCFLFFPTMLILTIVGKITGVNLGYSLLQLAGMVALICAFSTAFCLLLYTLIPNKGENAKMTGNTIIILTSFLTSGFYSFDEGNRLLELATSILPQKTYLTLANGVERGLPFSTYFPALIYLLVLIVAFFVLSAIKTKRAYVNKR